MPAEAISCSEPRYFVRLSYILDNNNRGPILTRLARARLFLYSQCSNHDVLQVSIENGERIYKISRDGTRSSRKARRVHKLVHNEYPCPALQSWVACFHQTRSPSVAHEMYDALERTKEAVGYPLPAAEHLGMSLCSVMDARRALKSSIRSRWVCLTMPRIFFP